MSRSPATPRRPRWVGLAILLILLTLPGSARSAGEVPDDTEIASYLESWRAAWESAQCLRLDALALPGEDPFQSLRELEAFERATQMIVALADITVTPTARTHIFRLSFVQGTEIRAPEGTTSRGVARVRLDLHRTPTGLRAATFRVEALAPDAQPTALQAGEPRKILDQAIAAIDQARLLDARRLLDALLGDPRLDKQIRSPFGPASIRAQALWLLGQAHHELGAEADAATAWEQALVIQPEFPLALNALAGHHRRAGELPIAIILWGRSLAAAPDQPEIQSLLRVHRKALFHYPDPALRRRYLDAATAVGEDALRKLGMLLAEDPAHVETRRRLATVYLLQYDPETAQRLLEEHEYYHPGDLETVYLLGRAAVARGRIEDALVWFKRIWEAHPGYRDALTWLSELNASNGRYGEAVRFLREALAREPDQPLWLYKLGVYTEELGDSAGARQHFEAAARARPPRSIVEDLRRRLAR